MKDCLFDLSVAVQNHGVYLSSNRAFAYDARHVGQLLQISGQLQQHCIAPIFTKNY
jgi:hypothetical protein